jgi:hypothetical protein
MKKIEVNIALVEISVKLVICYDVIGTPFEIPVASRSNIGISDKVSARASQAFVIHFHQTCKQYGSNDELGRIEIFSRKLSKRSRANSSHRIHTLFDSSVKAA